MQVIEALTDRAQLVEIRRRRAMDVRLAEGAVTEARTAQSLAALGQRVMDPPDLARAEARLEAAQAAVAEVDADIVAIDKAAADEAARVERERAQARAAAIEAADAELLEARRKADLTKLARLEAAPKGGDSYRKAVEAHLEAQRAVVAALAAREALEDDDE